MKSTPFLWSQAANSGAGDLSEQLSCCWNSFRTHGDEQGDFFHTCSRGRDKNLTYHVIERNMSSLICFILLRKLFQLHDKDSMANIIMIFYILHPLWWLFLIHYFWMSLSMLYILLHSGPGPGFIYFGYFILSLLNPPASLTFMPRNGHRVFPFYNSYMQKIHPSQKCPFHPQEESGATWLIDTTSPEIEKEIWLKGRDEWKLLS